ncbi:MAG: glycosyltransferase family 2 protein [Legionellaceae bacterium]|nr:glycosyltransferase family 2 protein [Legionellaceae bacterium]
MKKDVLDKPVISIVVPVYKEEDNISPFLSRVEAIMAKMELTYEIIFSLDPSPDNTEEVIKQESLRNSSIKCLVFSRRFGQPAATMAGILSSIGEYCVVIDVDLQDQPELIEEMYNKIQEGYDVVYAQRNSRKGETLIKRFVSYFGYSVINKLSDVKIPRNTGDFRIMSRRVVDELARLNESHGFLRGLTAFVGFKQTHVSYARDERFSGKGNYNRFLGSLKIGLNGLISFSIRPLQLMSIVGFCMAGFSFFIGIWYVLQKLFGVSLPMGFSTTILVITFFAGVQLLGLGLVGEYIGRIYDEIKRRPMYIIDRKINLE